MIIELWQTPNGRSPVWKFIEAEPPKAKNRIIKAVEHFEEQGLNLLCDKKKLEKLSGYAYIYELKVRFQGVAYRIFCYVRNGIATLLHAFKKKSNETRQHHIKLALERSKSLFT